MKEKITVSVISALLTALLTSFGLATSGWIRVQLTETAERQLIEKIRGDEELHLAVADKISTSLPPQWVSGIGPEENLDTGLLRSRSLRFTKKFDSTPVRIGYTDNLRVTGSHVGCRWEILIDGQSCPSGRLSYTYYSTAGVNPHRSRHVIGYCEGLSKNDHTVQIDVGPVVTEPTRDGMTGGNCSTGWQAATWTLEVQEILVRTAE